MKDAIASGAQKPRGGAGNKVGRTPWGTDIPESGGAGSSTLIEQRRLASLEQQLQKLGFDVAEVQTGSRRMENMLNKVRGSHCVEAPPPRPQTTRLRAPLIGRSGCNPSSFVPLFCSSQMLPAPAYSSLYGHVTCVT